MELNGFQIRRLSLIGPGVPKAEMDFYEGLNVISGPSDTGKTYILECIDFVLGAKDAPERIPESEKYDTARLAIFVASDGTEVELERPLRGGNITLSRSGRNEERLPARHDAKGKSSLSSYLLGLSGASGKKVRTNKLGSTRNVSFRDLARLVLVDEEKVISKTSPALSGQYTGKTAESGVFRFLLSGKDDSSLKVIDEPAIQKGKHAGKVEILELLVQENKERLVQLNVQGDADTWRVKLVETEAHYSRAQEELQNEQRVVSELEGQRRAEVGRLRRLESRAGVLRELQQRFGLLKQQYMSDLQRLESMAEAGFRLNQMPEERCHVCGATAEHQDHLHEEVLTSPDDIAQSCLAESVKIKALITDLALTMQGNREEISNFNGEIAHSKEHISAIGVELSERLKPRIQAALQRFRDSQSSRDVFRHALELANRAADLQKMLFVLQRELPRESLELESANVRSDEADEFTKHVEVLLRDWHFPNSDRVTFSESSQDIVISGRQRASHGKGVRAIAHAAFNLGLLRFSVKKGKPHPGFVLIDSPLVVYREPDTDEEGFALDVKDAFYRSIAKEFSNSQVIIFENEDPPADLALNAHIVRFTRAQHGRYGFFPKTEKE